jgi:hypothetical protein
MTSTGLCLRRRANAIGVGFALIALLVAGCSDMDAARPVTIVNLTTGPIEVALHERSSAGVDHLTSPMTIPPGARQGFYGTLLHSCMTGSLVATQDGRTVATIEKPCEGSRWEITDKGASQSS